MKNDIEKKYDNLIGDLHKLENVDFMQLERTLRREQIPKKDPESDNLNKKISSYGQKEENIFKDPKLGDGLRTARGYIRKGEGILSKHMDFGLTTCEMAFGYIKEAGDSIEKDKHKYDSSELNKLKEELANFSEALARKIKNDVNQKDNEYSLKKELSDEEKKGLQEYKQTIRNKALKLAEDAVSYAKKLMKD